MLAWLSKLRLILASSQNAKEIQAIIDDLDRVKLAAFEELTTMEVGQRLTSLRLLNQIIDSELAAHRYKQSERRIRNSLYLAVIPLVGSALFFFLK